MALGPKRAAAPVPATANIAGIIAALGSDVISARYDGGTLYVNGVTQAALDAQVAMADTSHATRAAKKQQAQQQLAARVAAGMMWQSKPLQIDDMSVVRIMAGVSAADHDAIPPGFAWRMADNSPLPLDAAGMIAMGTAAFGYVFALRTRYWQIVDAVNAAPDGDAVEAIDPTAGWPVPPA